MELKVETLNQHDVIICLCDRIIHTLTSRFSSNSTNNFLAAHSLPSIFFASFSPDCLFLKSSVELANAAMRAGCSSPGARMGLGDRILAPKPVLPG